MTCKERQPTSPCQVWLASGTIRQAMTDLFGVFHWKPRLLFTVRVQSLLLNSENVASDVGCIHMAHYVVGERVHLQSVSCAPAYAHVYTLSRSETGL